MSVFAAVNSLEPAHGHLHVLVNCLSIIFVKATFARPVVATLDIELAFVSCLRFFMRIIFFQRFTQDRTVGRNVCRRVLRLTRL